MIETVIESKLLPPRLRQRVVPRSRLEGLLRRGSERTLTLIAAPAGFGKTTLLAAWFAGADAPGPIAWISLDDRDAEPSSFWNHLLLAIDRAIPGVATAALAQFRSGQAGVEDVLSVLGNDLSVTANDLVVVLDDYHLAESPAIQPGMHLFVDHLPPQAHLVISTRVDPALPLARLRARGELVEIRAADLRFSSDEAVAYLNGINTLALEAADVAVLQTRTEGWAAALQLAALSLHGRDDRAQFIAGFAGDDRFIVDYLADEVLDSQPPEVRRFLLNTSVLDELTGPLCDAINEATDGKPMLEVLERQNLFLVPLDDRRQRYRYHHLFADVLRARLLDERPEDAPVLHRRASDWYDHEGQPEAAVRHALAAGDVNLAAERVELAIPALQRERREAVIRRWVHDLPADVVRSRPVLAVGFIGALMSSNEFKGVDQRLRDAERLLDAPVEGLVVADRGELVRLPATLQTYRAALALVTGDLGGTAHHAELALALAATDDHLSIASASALVGLAAWTTGDLDAAHAAYRKATQHLERAGHLADVLGCSITLADIDMIRGRLDQARQTFEHALSLAASSNAPPRGVADMYVGLSRVCWERNDLTEAAEFLRKADEVGDEAGLPQNPYRWRVMMACLRDAAGDTASAIELLDEAERVYVGDFSPNVRAVAATRARLLAAAGDLPRAAAWARRRGVSAADELVYLSEYDHLTLARVLMCEHAATGSKAALEDASALLARILATAQAGGRTGTVIETLVMQALAQRAEGAIESAVSTLARAVDLAEPEGYVRVFVQEGTAMAELLAALTGRRPDNAFARRLVQTLQTAEPRSIRSAGSRAGRTPGSGPSPHSGDPGADGGRAQALVDPLSSREHAVLRLLGTDLGGPDIARELHVSLSTVRTHTQHIYAKLGVNNRRAAVGRAHQLDLFRV